MPKFRAFNGMLNCLSLCISITTVAVMAACRLMCTSQIFHSARYIPGATRRVHRGRTLIVSVRAYCSVLSSILTSHVCCRKQGAIDAARHQNNLQNALESNQGGQITGEANIGRKPAGGNLLRKMVGTAEGGADTRRFGNRMPFSDDEITRQVMR